MFEEILLEIGLIEEMRTTRRNKEVSLTFFTIPFICKNTI